MKKKNKKISAGEFDAKFDAGEDVSEHLEMKSAKIVRPSHRINIDIPADILAKVDKEAERMGIPRTSLIKVWIAERLDRLAG